MASEVFDIDGLVERANAAVRRGRVRIDDQRVAGAIDVRVIRYYQTLGILDRPLRYEGRSAVYGVKHVSQLRAIKVLQQEGLSLQQLQQRLVGCSEDELAGIGEVVKGAPQTAQDAGGVVSEVHRLIGVEVVPGVQLTIDPARWPEAEALAARLAGEVRRVVKEFA